LFFCGLRDLKFWIMLLPLKKDITSVECYNLDIGVAFQNNGVEGFPWREVLLVR
jgi:hypothetical protein